MADVRLARILFALPLLTAALRAGDDPFFEGVKEIGVPGVPGVLSVYGEGAVPILAAPSGSGPAVVAAAVRLGRGRVVVLGHEGWFGKETLAQADTKRFVLNAAAWVSRGGKHLGVRGNDALREALGAEDLAGPKWTKRLSEFRAVYLPVGALDDESLRVVAAYVKRGGGLLIGQPGWGWSQLNPGKDLATENPANRLLAPAGVVLGADSVQVPASRRLPAAPPDELLHGAKAFAALRRGPSALAVATLTRCVNDLPPDDTLLLPKLAALARGGQAPLPSAKRPLGPELGRVLLAMQVRSALRAPADEIEAHPAAETFPGAVPRAAPRIVRTVEIDTSVPDWHSTGLYAAPGERLVVTAKAPGLSVRIGAHADRLWHVAKWRRAPEITRTFPLQEGRTEAACAFGGPIYVVVPRVCALGTVTVEIRGGVEMAWFELGRTDPAEWRASIRQRPAPWAELGTAKVVLTLPAAVVRELDDPTALLRFWDTVLDACADLAVRPRERARPERYVTDEQISAGYMHAGYPIMTHLDAAPRFVDLATLRTKGDWGMFHEMGHNHQSPDWTFEGTGEVTVNLFTMYVLETVCGNLDGHEAISDRAVANWIERYRAGGRQFAQWKSQPFLALVMYKQLKDAFGWKPFHDVFAEYRALPAGDRPRNDAEKRDQWLVRFSKTVGRDLGPFFEDWGIPVSAKARAAVADLPPWRP